MRTAEFTKEQKTELVVNDINLSQTPLNNVLSDIERMCHRLLHRIYSLPTVTAVLNLPSMDDNEVNEIIKDVCYSKEQDIAYIYVSNKEIAKVLQVNFEYLLNNNRTKDHIKVGLDQTVCGYGVVEIHFEGSYITEISDYYELGSYTCLQNFKA